MTTTSLPADQPLDSRSLSGGPGDDGIDGEKMRIFVHLARGFGAAQWQAKWERGEVIGLNERLPYGFFWAREAGCTVEYSEDYRESRLGAAFRLMVRALLGFDLVHAWRNRHGIFAAKVVWTGTESQHLAVLFMLLGRSPRRRPKVIAQSIWLFDIWPRLSAPKRWLYTRLMANAALLTVHSDEGLNVARALFPNQRAMTMLYGIRVDKIAHRKQRVAPRPIRVLSAGHDRHRDWATLLAALGDWPEAELRIVTPRLPRGTRPGANVTLVQPKNNDEYIALYRWADIVALALNPNLHGSGITVVEEAVVLGLPVVVADGGALKCYFSEEELRYVPPGDPAAMRAAIAALADDPAERARMVERAQRRMIDAGLTSRDFAQRHAALSRELLYGATVVAIEETPPDAPLTALPSIPA
jgi:glycosyltransferase involved in cell wall biosynthesis